MNNSKKNTGHLRKFVQEVHDELREHKWTFIIYTGLRILVILTMILQILNRSYEDVFLCILTLVLLILPSVVQVTFKISLPTPLEITMLAFVFAAEILGEISAFYIKFAYWDTILHTLNGFLCAAIGFSLVDILNRSERFHMTLSPLFTAITAFCFSMTIGVLWEFFEFSGDMLLNLDMQKDTVIHTISSTMLDATATNTVVHINNITDVSVNGNTLPGYLDIGLIDTMEDLIVNFIGATIFSIIGYFYVKKRKTKSIISGFVPVRKK